MILQKEHFVYNSLIYTIRQKKKIRKNIYCNTKAVRTYCNHGQHLVRIFDVMILISCYDTDLTITKRTPVFH